MKLLNYLSEDVKYYNNHEEWVDMIVSLINKDAKLFNLPIIWRGWNAKLQFYCAEVSGAGQRQMIRGQLGLSGSNMRDWVKEVVKGLGFVPVCCSYSYSQASFFGNPCVVIPESNFKIYQNPDVTDIATTNPGTKQQGKVQVTTYDFSDAALQKILDGYSEDYSDRNGEILLKCSNYYLINVRRIMQIARQSKFNKISDIKDIKSYQQLIDFIFNFRSYLKFIESRRPK
jgi:hypothetical protein